jgi:anti-anti-sigma regulatory factor
MSTNGMDNCPLTTQASGSLRLDANLGPAAAESLRLNLLNAIQAGAAGGNNSASVRLDAVNVEQLSTASLQVLLSAARQLQTEGRQLVLESPSPQLLEWVRLSGAPQALLGFGSNRIGRGSGGCHV